MEKIYTFKASDISQEVILHLEKLKQKGLMGDFIRDAISTYHTYTTNPRYYFRTLIEMNFGLIRHILRKVGREQSDKINKTKGGN